MSPADVLDEVRAACARVTGRARHVRIDEGRLATYDIDVPEPEPEPGSGPRTEDEVALVVELDAVNFGSGWHPVLRKLPGRSGSVTIAAALSKHGRFTSDELVELSAQRCADLFGQDLDSDAGELMALFARSLVDLGRFVTDRFGGSFTAMVESAERSSSRLVDLLLEMPLYRDIPTYEGRPVPLLKRAQITVNDLGPAWFDDIERLTMFPDNLVPHVLRVDGVLVLDRDLEARIDRGELLAYGSPEEIELRAVALTAVDRLSRTTGRPARLLDEALWLRGGRPRYKAIPRPRSRTTAY